MSDPKQKFDLEAVYDADIAPLMTKIIEICKAHKLPMFATFLYKNDGEGDSGCCTTNMLFEDQRPVPASFANLYYSLVHRAPALHMRVRKGDGSVEDTVILP